MSQLRISYTTERFPLGTVANGNAVLGTDWNELLWAAVTVGRPNRYYVFRHGNASFYEAIFRISLMRMGLEQREPSSRRLTRTAAFKCLDATEKGAINYFIGMAVCKLFAFRLLDTPWLLHVDLARPQLTRFLRGRSRPDLVGQDRSQQHWHVFECKGRASVPDANVKRKAKRQALRLVSVNGNNCTLHVGAITYYRGDTLAFFWRDPRPDEEKGIDVPLPGDVWSSYYAPVLETIRTDDNAFRRMLDEQTLFDIPGIDVKVGVHPKVLRMLANSQWEEARAVARGLEQARTIDGDIGESRTLRPIRYRPDGIAVVAGESWARRQLPIF